MVLRPREFFADKQAIELAEAISRGSPRRVQNLIGQGVALDTRGKDGVYPLLWALLNDELECFRVLIRAGASPNQLTDDQDSVVGFAAQHNNSAYLEESLKWGGNVDIRDKRENTPLILAAMKMKPHNIKLLLTRRAQIDLQDQAGWSALMHATANNRPEQVKLLLDAGADPDLTAKSGMSARDIAKNTAGAAVKALFARP